MTNNYIQQLHENNFVQETKYNGKLIHHLTTPCRFKVKNLVVKSLKEKYLPDEEIGGVLWAKPTSSEKEKIYIVDKITYVRNAIEDKPLTDKNGRKLTKHNAYLPDGKEISEAYKKIFSSEYLPVKFHTHPTKGHNVIDQLSLQQLQTETSDQDKLESENTHPIDEHNLLMPRALIVGNRDLGSDIFIGLYNGFISPDDFDESKRKVQQENFNGIANTISDKISSWDLSDNEKIGYGIGSALLLGFLVYKTRKFSVPVILGLAVLTPMLLTNTGTIEQPNYFNKLSLGDADIYIPKWDANKNKKSDK